MTTLPARKETRLKPTSNKRPKFRSGLEQEVKAALGAQAEYESIRIFYEIPARVAQYTPDFILKNGIIVETKGLFEVDDRQKMLLVREQYPDMDIRMVFTNPNAKIYKGSPTTYGMWCEKHGILFAKKAVPAAWVKEKPCRKRLAAIAALPSKQEKCAQTEN